MPLPQARKTFDDHTNQRMPSICLGEGGFNTNTKSSSLNGDEVRIPEKVLSQCWGQLVHAKGEPILVSQALEHSHFLHGSSIKNS